MQYFFLGLHQNSTQDNIYYRWIGGLYMFLCYLPGFSGFSHFGPTGKILVKENPHSISLWF